MLAVVGTLYTAQDFCVSEVISGFGKVQVVIFSVHACTCAPLSPGTPKRCTKSCVTILR